jgi:hypothetical protein
MRIQPLAVHATRMAACRGLLQHLAAWQCKIAAHGFQYNHCCSLPMLQLLHGVLLSHACLTWPHPAASQSQCPSQPCLHY